MASNLSSIGFRVSSENHLLQLVQRAALAGRPVRTRAGSYVRWSSDCGAELWIQLDEDNEVSGVNPHFNSSTRMRVGLTAALPRPGKLMDGSFQAWVNPPERHPDEGEYPLVFDAPDFACHASLKLPAIVQVQLAAFAQELSVYENVETYAAAQESKFKFDTRCFIPTGMFNPRPEGSQAPEAYAMLAGEVLQAALLVNPLSELTFSWARVSTLGGEIELVADPTILEHPMAPGCVVRGVFWLSGRFERASRRRGKGLLTGLMGN